MPVISPAADEEQQPVLQEVIITGSRIPVPPTVTATSPITVVTHQDIAVQGRTDMSDLLNSLPQTSINSANDFGNTLALILGTDTKGGAGNVTGYFVYHHQDGVPGSLYDFADCLYRAHIGCSDSPNSNEFSVAGTQTRFRASPARSSASTTRPTAISAVIATWTWRRPCT
jgi:hypothetical protein